MTDCIEDTKERIKIMQAYVKGEPIEYSNRYPIYDASSGRIKIWGRVETPQWNWSEYDYRVAVVEESIDWEQVEPSYNYLARDEDARPYLFQTRPELSWGKWKVPTEAKKVGWCVADAFTSYKKGNKRWDLSLVVRPGFVEAERAANEKASS